MYIILQYNLNDTFIYKYNKSHKYKIVEIRQYSFNNPLFFLRQVETYEVIDTHLDLLEGFFTKVDICDK